MSPSPSALEAARQRPAFLEVIVRVTDDSFESRLTVPVSASKEELQKVSKAWIETLQQAIQMCGGKDASGA